MITLGRLSQTTELSDQTVNQMISCSSSEESNQQILDYLIVAIKRDIDLLDFCTTLLKLLETSAVVESLRAGQCGLIVIIYEFTVRFVDCIRVLDPDASSPPQETVAKTAITTTPTTLSLSRHSSASSVSTTDATPDTTATVNDRKGEIYHVQMSDTI